MKKAVIIARKIQATGNMLKPITNICYGLVKNNYHVTWMLDSNYRISNIDLLIQWGYKKPQRERFERFKLENKYVKSLYVDLGWFDRTNNVLFYDEFLRRENIVGCKGRHHEDFDKKIEKNPKVWLVLMQLPKDANVRNCKNYEKWLLDVKNILETKSRNKVIFRRHPKEHKEKMVVFDNVEYSDIENLDNDLSRAVGVVSWSSSAVLQAMIHNIPTCVYDFPEIHNVVQRKLTHEWIKKVDYSKSEQCNKFVERALHGLAAQQKSHKELTKLCYDNLNFGG